MTISLLKKACELLENNARFVIAAIYKALFNAGYNQENIDHVFSPIGLAIGAQSPAEIAVSIVAELIQQRAWMSI
jgi:xanthine dehydrogenase accessory factor